METDATISDETDKRIGLNSFVYYFSMTYTSIIATESIVTIWMNLRKAFSGKSFTRRIPSKAPIPITGSIRRFSENEPQVILFVCAKLRLLSYNIIHYICVIVMDICTNADNWRLCLY